jgi:LysM repeat protein
MSGAPKLPALLGFPVSAPCSERSPLGCHSKPPRIRIPHGAPSAAAPTLASVAAALCLAPQASPAPPAAQPAPHHAAVLDAAYQAGLAPAQLMTGTRQQATKQKPASRLPARYTVRHGDSLSAIAGHFYHNPAAWPVLYWRNRGQVRWADVIETGQVLRIPREPARIPAPPALLGPPPTVTDYTPRHARPAPAPAEAVPAQAAPVQAGPGQAGPGQAGPGQAAPAQAAPAAPAGSYSGAVPGGAFGRCVVSRESGGQAQIMNTSGHYGLYQFSASTWAAYGGNPADFGNASVAEQNQVFANALGQGGESNWAPYDGC